MSNTIEIKKVRLKSNGKLEVGYVKTEGEMTINVPIAKYSTQTHQDLRVALANLRVHYKALSEQITEKGKTDEFTVTGYTVGGKEGDEWVILTGYRTLSNGQAFNYNTPLTRFQASDEEGEGKLYKDIKKLIKALESVDNEVLEYMEGKAAPDPQTSLQFEEGETLTTV